MAEMEYMEDDAVAGGTVGKMQVLVHEKLIKHKRHPNGPNSVVVGRRNSLNMIDSLTLIHLRVDSLSTV